MYQEFLITSIEANLKERAIHVFTNDTLDRNSIDEIVIELLDIKTKEEVPFDVEVFKNRLSIKLRDWPKVNNPYIFYVKELKNILGQTTSGTKRKIEFKSTIVDEVEIMSPVMHEEVKSLNIKHKVKVKSEEKKEDIYVKIQISTDNAFYNITKEMDVYDEKDIIVSKINKGQNYLRARVQSEAEYGNWTKTVSFIYEKEACEEVEEEEKEDFIPEYEDMTDDIEIDDIADFDVEVNYESGITPEELILIFTKDLDEYDFSESQIKIYRKEIR